MRWLIGVALALAAGPKPGVVRGTVTLAGDAPARAAIAPDVDKAVCGKPDDDAVALGKGGALAGAVVWLEGVAGKVAPAAITVDQRGCRFTPRVQAAALGSTVRFVNSDPVLHNVHAYADHETAFNLATTAGGDVTRELDEPGLVELKCDVHTWMRASVWVFDHPFFAVTGADGAFELRGVPEGKYVVRAWHELLGVLEGKAVVKRGGTATVDLAYAAQK